MAVHFNSVVYLKIHSMYYFILVLFIILLFKTFNYILNNLNKQL